MKSTSGQNHFSQVPTADIPRSSFDRSSGYKTTIDAQYLYPFFVDEILPGDTFNLNTTALARLATPIKPTMDNMFLETFFFFIPNRLVWDNWEKLNGQQDNPGDSIDYLVPEFPAPSGGFPLGSKADFFALPTGVDNISVSALPFRAADLCWNEWFRDENLQDSIDIPKGDGPDTTGNDLFIRGKRHDYFTSSLPAPQKGDSVKLPLGTQAPINADGTQGDVITVGLNTTENVRNISTDTSVANIATTASGTAPLYADLTDATAATINELRQAFQVQKMLERDMRSGTRYTESIKAHFGVTNPDFRLQRPEYLGGGSTPINITPVPQTSDTLSGGPGAETPQGNLAAYGTAHVKGHGFTKSFTEHGHVIGFVNIRADLTYQDGINRMWSRRTRYDHYYPALSHLGEQAVLNKEIFAQGTAADEDVFGYQEIFAEFRYKPSVVTNLMRSKAATSVDVWHLAQDFENLPTLSPEFIQDNPPIDRIIATPDEPQFIMDVYFALRCARPMPLYGVPGMIDHF